MMLYDYSSRNSPVLSREHRHETREIAPSLLRENALAHPPNIVGIRESNDAARASKSVGRYNNRECPLDNNNTQYYA
ncbi:hypothetical protein I7I48_03744 [Histoplasma ohiense]|nr:hypothetical protein I7I48_03744 [Histoplasma ohiense (nom. inval.)]